MATLLLNDDTNPQCVICEPRRARTSLWTRRHAWRLDHALASGACPDSNAALSLRAQALIGMRARRDRARSIRRLIGDARHPLGALGPVPICRHKVLRSTGTLEALAARLVSCEPVDARGVAQVCLVLAAADGPVYSRPWADDLEPALQAAADALEPSVAGFAAR